MTSVARAPSVSIPVQTAWQSATFLDALEVMRVKNIGLNES
jgi:hypothetical protein